MILKMAVDRANNRCFKHKGAKNAKNTSNLGQKKETHRVGDVGFATNYLISLAWKRLLLAVLSVCSVVNCFI